jgi:hypothetical protein
VYDHNIMTIHQVAIASLHHSSSFACHVDSADGRKLRRLLQPSFMKIYIHELVQKLVEGGSNRVLQYDTTHLPFLTKKKQGIRNIHSKTLFLL